MKNAWKGLIIGALTGMIGGSTMDVASGARRKVAAVARDVLGRDPSSAEKSAAE